MRCSSSQNENPAGASICEWCGADLSAPKNRTVYDAPSIPPSAPPVSGPSEKRRTLYEPGGPAASRPAADDFFGNPPPARPPVRNPDDPFAQSIPPRVGRPAPAPAAAAQQAAPPPAAAAAPVTPPPGVQVRSRTIINNPPRAVPAAGTAPVAVAPSSTRRMRGALFLFADPDDPGTLFPVYEGRNSLGRAEDRDVVLDDGRVSAEHGFLFLRPDRQTFVDTSTNGSRVDGQVVYGEQVVVQSGSVLELGGLRLVLVVIPAESLAAAANRT